MIRAGVHQRAIRINHQTLFPSSVIYLDTETRQEDLGEFQRHYFRLGWGCYVEIRPEREKDSETWKFFDKPWAFSRWIESLCRAHRPLYVFSHNLFFDLQVMGFYDYMPKTGWELDFLYEQGMSYILIVRNGDFTIKGISTTNYFDTSLEALGELIGYEKGKVDFETVSDEELSAYCRRDVEILKKIMEYYFTFLRDHDLGKFGATKAAQAFNAYRHRFMAVKIYTHKEEKIIDLEKESYLGGRTECFRMGEIKGGPKVSLDVNSMYSFLMKRYHFPRRFLAYHENVPPSRLSDLIGNLCAVAEVLVDTDEPCFAVRQGVKIIFPVGRFRCCLCTRGLHLALSKGMIKGVTEIALYEPADLFSLYVDFFYALKAKYDKEGNKIFRKLVKYFLNCLYGKFGQFRPIMNWFSDPGGIPAYRVSYFDETTGESGVEYKLMNRVIRETGKEIAPNSLVAICAHITEDARLYLDEIIRGIGRDRVLYCDTDSVKIMKHDLARVKHKIDPDGMGSLKVEEEYDHLTILGPKSYLTDKKQVLKGVPKRAEKVGHLMYSYTSFPRQTTHLRKRIVDHFETRTVIKQVRELYDKGVVTSSGRVTPFRLAEF